MKLSREEYIRVYPELFKALVSLRVPWGEFDSMLDAAIDGLQARLAAHYPESDEDREERAAHKREVEWLKEHIDEVHPMMAEIWKQAQQKMPHYTPKEESK